MLCIFVLIQIMLIPDVKRKLNMMHMQNNKTKIAIAFGIEASATNNDFLSNLTIL